MDAGQFDRRVTFQGHVMVETDMGGVIEGWEDRFTLWAHVRYLRGSEAVMQARLVSKAPVIITVRRSVESEGITSEWRAVVGGVIFDLKEDPRPSEDGGFLEMLGEG
ncbi:phage head closure protein [Paracoccus sphaerophysae]|uniref:Head-tail adaptor protein n=1 Tax=Paracoccus sphaerophysae TaxID=690417 RepID=A0A099FG66_9RHOB|nr:phage head closure protein [Paracoccus sphaerophysae]KGJ09750.1 head-tail adaptor protein [Paracoccus sphaerophysae]